MPCDYNLYPPDWEHRRQRKLFQHNFACQGSPRYPACRARQYYPHPITGSKVILALCHFDGDITNNEDENLYLWCQRCHLLHDLCQHIRSRRYGRLLWKQQFKIDL